MDHLYSESEVEELFVKTDTLDDFFELEERWEANRRTNDHPYRRFLHMITDEHHTDHPFDQKHQ